MWPSRFQLIGNQTRKNNRNETKVTHTVVLVDLHRKTSLNFCHLPAYLGSIFYPITEKQVKIMDLRIAIYLKNHPLERTEDHFFSHLRILTKNPSTAGAYLVVVHMVRMVPRIISATNNTTSLEPATESHLRGAHPNRSAEKFYSPAGTERNQPRQQQVWWCRLLKGETAGLLYNYLLEENSNWIEGSKTELPPPCKPASLMQPLPSYHFWVKMSEGVKNKISQHYGGMNKVKTAFS